MNDSATVTLLLPRRVCRRHMVMPHAKQDPADRAFVSSVTGSVSMMNMN
jgi:hypothetical protein